VRGSMAQDTRTMFVLMVLMNTDRPVRCSRQKRSPDASS
jgi:hypothetical protein